MSAFIKSIFLPWWRYAVCLLLPRILTESPPFLSGNWHLTSTASKWQVAGLHMPPSRARVWWRRSSLDSPWGWSLAACGRCTTGMSRGRLDPSTTCWTRARSASLLRSSFHASSLKLFSPSCFWNSLVSMTKWMLWRFVLKNKHNHLRTPDFVWISSIMNIWTCPCHTKHLI